ncbi:potassium-transporting ATPase subunit KdpC [Candidatus Cyanaurora vandensis]|uniref:potassium-transporting ATPase subunit KdpC n=1 Tax=Candidatus Cyanaurora vandensis TaxID=2714958 RepID=UPI00257D15F9|nr:potassium-transporting ATPase subunit KdpC [Candidatus Cyanaurora vandensis]
MSMLKETTTALRMSLFLILVCGLGYPLLTTGIAQTVFPAQANGSLIQAQGQTVGSRLIGQNFTSDRYFQGRISSLTYKAEASGNPNYGPTNQAYLDRVRTDVARLTQRDGTPPPIDLVTNSGSGLDPHITPAGARVQVPRIARTRGLEPSRVQQLVEQNTTDRTLGIFGEPHINVLALNLALDQLR